MTKISVLLHCISILRGESFTKKKIEATDCQNKSEKVAWILTSLFKADTTECVNLSMAIMNLIL